MPRGTATKKKVGTIIIRNGTAALSGEAALAAIRQQAGGFHGLARATPRRGTMTASATAGIGPVAMNAVASGLTSGQHDAGVGVIPPQDRRGH